MPLSKEFYLDEIRSKYPNSYNESLKDLRVKDLADMLDFLDEALERRIFSEKQVNEIKSRIKGVVGTENVNTTTDLIIEAVFEDFDIKTAVFKTLDECWGLCLDLSEEYGHSEIYYGKCLMGEYRNGQ